MPVYEYYCEACDSVFSSLQSIDAESKENCPDCGVECLRIVSRVSMKIKKDVSADKAAEKGFTTYKKGGDGVWDKVAGDGVDHLVGSDADKQAVKEEKKPKKVYDLDK